MRLSFTIADCAESALLVQFGSTYPKELGLAILNASERLRVAALPGLRESIPAVSSLTVFYDPLQLPRQRLVAELESLFGRELTSRRAGRTWEIPVVYGGEGGPDLKEAAKFAGLGEDETVSLHSGRLYRVYMLGFLPGFAYLGELPEPLRLPRRAIPRARVPAGSVAIAAEMTAVYPLESPGGWHLIGATPVVLWDMERYDEPLFKPGDWVRFRPISADEAKALRQEAAAGWRPNPVEKP
jgi:KipI family sensor histidine kinase inhibitor